MEISMLLKTIHESFIYIFKIKCRVRSITSIMPRHYRKKNSQFSQLTCLIFKHSLGISKVHFRIKTQ
ncbi:hypothetical protein MANES_13G082512v8 [Manihot esculenta]|uniref:Uncharacterized protein n=1 Tax=Manihot esculenta TaxID=3983 RepID=A0ACB7GKF3_MANES|nr:hypothetical protein MANES_13G082512v8 [Manihot esculenta]